jgi:hypothetical protein
LIDFSLLPLWVGARGIEFDWRYIQLSLDSNISLVCFVCFIVQNVAVVVFICSAGFVTSSVPVCVEQN